MKIERLKSVDSTNLYIRRYLDGEEDTIVTADIQTGGRGTKGRSFLSDEGGVYLTKLTFHKDMKASDTFCVMLSSAVAVCKTVEVFGASPEIKWPNDVRVNGKKISGTLIETVLSGNMLRASIVGIGLNVKNDVSAIGEIAVNLATVCKKVPTVEAVREKLIEELQKSYSLSDYLSFVRFLGKKVSVLEGDSVYEATAEAVMPDGRLKVRTDEGEKLLSSAEISLRF